jgi:hypothetical protein
MKKMGLASLTVAVALTAAEPVTVIKAARMFDGTRDHVTSPGLVVVSGGNPEENIRVVEKVFFVMRDGVVFRNR